jgi:alkanesulfonate monooxygenase SsuD/methylene tetrahydromethanopterin reductase-like flavin-dependent oxidoreductase (luciferase family)
VIIAGRASIIGIFELLGYIVRDYDELFEENFDLLLKINEEEVVDWSGQFRAPLNNARVLPRPQNGSIPIWRAVGGHSASAIKASYAGIPIFLASLGGPATSFKVSIDAYREAAERGGFDSATLPIATAGFYFAAETTQQVQNAGIASFSEQSSSSCSNYARRFETNL